MSIGKIFQLAGIVSLILTIVIKIISHTSQIHSLRERIELLELWQSNQYNESNQKIIQYCLDKKETKTVEECFIRKLNNQDAP